MITHTAAHKTHEFVKNTHEHKLTKIDHAIHHLANTSNKKAEKKANTVSKTFAEKAIPLDKTNPELEEFNS